MKKLKEKYVLVIVSDLKNYNKKHYILCENMEIAKREFSDSEKRFVTLLTDNETE